MICNVLSDVAHSAVGADNYFLILFRKLLAFANTGSGTLHHPATFILARRRQVEHATFFQFGEGRVPKMQVKDLTLTRQEIVFNAQPIHGHEMAAKHHD